MDLFKYLVEEYGYNEPIFSEDVVIEINGLKPNTIRQTLKRLTDNNQLLRYKEGIYFIPDPKSKSKYNTLSTKKVIDKKYLYNKNNERIGYITGLSLANSLKLTTQNPAKVELISNVEKATVRMVDFNKQKVIVRKPRTIVNNNNFKVLQILDLITNFEKLSTKSINEAAKTILEYLKDVELTKEQLNSYLNNYPDKTYRKIIKSNLYDAMTKRGSVEEADEITT